MSSLNRIILIGRLTKDPEVRTTQTGLTVASFRLAVDRPGGGQGQNKETDFFKIVAWRQSAEYVANYLGKGRLVAVEGRLQNSNWVGQDGQTRYDMEIVADRVQGLDRPREAGEGGGRSEEGDFGREPADDMNMADDAGYDPFADE